MTHWKSALRTLARRPAFTLATALILALGIGATTTLFSLIDAVLWKPLAYPNPDRVVTVYETNPAKNQNTSLVAPGRLEDWNRLSQSFECIAGYHFENVTETSGSEPDRLAALRVGPRFFRVMGTPPVIGRVLTPEEEKDGGPLAAVLSYRLWQRRYHGDPSVLGKRMVLKASGYTIVGVMPDGFMPNDIDLWIPAQINDWLMRQRDARFFQGVGRMKAGITPAQAQAELAGVQASLARQFPATDEGWSAEVRDLKEQLVHDQRASLSIMFWAVVLLLLIACANAGGLMLGQLHRRERELAIRSSLGASRSQLVGVILREVVALVTAGAAAGVGLSIWGVSAIRATFITIPRIEEVRLDWRALLFAIGTSVVAAVAFGLAPAFETLRTELSGRLYQATRTQGRGRRRLQQVLVASQFAVTLVLMLGTGLLVRSYAKLNEVRPGFDPSHLIAFHVGAQWGEDRAMIGRMQRELLDEFAKLPGVQATGLTNFLPATDASLRFEVALEGSRGDAGTGKALVGERTLGGNYIEAMRIPLLEGQGCGELPTNFKAPAKAIVNQSFVDKYSNGLPMVGRRVSFDPTVTSSSSRIVGVIADAKEDGLNTSAFPYVYMCLAGGSWPDPNYVVRTAGNPEQMLSAVRQVVHRVAPGRAVFGIKTLEDVLSRSLNKPRLNSEVLALFGGTALVLASVGLYSLVMLAVTAQTKEIGLRVALGAEPLRIVLSVIVDAARPVLFGLAVGAALAAVALNTKALRSELFGVTVTDGVTMVAAVATLAFVAVIASLGPARRAAAIDPIQALREE